MRDQVARGHTMGGGTIVLATGEVCAPPASFVALTCPDRKRHAAQGRAGTGI